MNNFGVIELASAKTTNAPGWAYVADTRPATTAQPQQPGNRKRGARYQAASNFDVSARQEAKLRRELEALDRDNSRDTVIPVPPKPGAAAQNRAQQQQAAARKHTPNVRKILQSQKTFANHLDDFEAMLAQSETNPNHNSNNSNNAVGPSYTASTLPAQGADAASHRRLQSQRKAEPQIQQEEERQDKQQEDAGEDVEMRDATTVEQPQPESSEETATKDDSTAKAAANIPKFDENDPLLVSRLPPIPTDEELAQLLSAPPPNYLELRLRSSPATLNAKGGGGGRRRMDENSNTGSNNNGNDLAGGATKYPARRFCDVCGYWGRVRCLRCGTRCCALECLEAHREECVTRYGM